VETVETNGNEQWETNGNGKWCSVTETLSILGISRKTLYQRLKDEKLISKKNGKNRFFWIDDVTETFTETFTETQRETKETLPKQGDMNVVTQLQEQLDYFKSKVEVLEREKNDLVLSMQEQVKRHDTIVMQLSQQNQLLLDKPRPFWKFW